jgi:hypothetical protein
MGIPIKSLYKSEFLCFNPIITHNQLILLLNIVLQFPPLVKLYSIYFKNPLNLYMFFDSNGV